MKSDLGFAAGATGGAATGTGAATTGAGASTGVTTGFDAVFGALTAAGNVSLFPHLAQNFAAPRFFSPHSAQKIKAGAGGVITIFSPQLAQNFEPSGLASLHFGHASANIWQVIAAISTTDKISFFTTFPCEC